MNTKTIVGGFTGGVVYFLLGWLIYGVLLAGWYEANFNDCMQRDMESFIWWAMIGSNLIWGFFTAVILNWASAKGFIDGIRVGVIVGLLISLAMGLSYYAMTTMYPGKSVLALEVLISTAFIGFVSGVTAEVMGRVGN